MNGFEDREKGFEAKYRVDQETQFRITARRNKLLGEWAAGQMGLTGQAAESYASDVVASDFSEPGDADVIGKVFKDLFAKGVGLGEGDIRKKLDEFAAVARQQIVGQPK